MFATFRKNILPSASRFKQKSNLDCWNLQAVQFITPKTGDPQTASYHRRPESSAMPLYRTSNLGPFIFYKISLHKANRSAMYRCTTVGADNPELNLTCILRCLATQNMSVKGRTRPHNCAPNWPSSSDNCSTLLLTNVQLPQTRTDSSYHGGRHDLTWSLDAVNSATFFPRHNWLNQTTTAIFRQRMLGGHVYCKTRTRYDCMYCMYCTVLYVLYVLTAERRSKLICCFNMWKLCTAE